MSLIQRRLNNIDIWLAAGPNPDPGLYHIRATSYKRKNAEEKNYLNKYLLPVLRIWDCRCGICGADSEGLEMDHFWIPKDRGGNLVMKLREGGTYVNNGVPTCTSCNRAKSNGTADLPPFKQAQINMINRWATAIVNDGSVEMPTGISDCAEGDEALASEPGLPAAFGVLSKLALEQPESMYASELRMLIREYLLVQPVSRRPWEILR